MEYIDQHPIDIKTKDDFVMYCYHMHNSINEKLGLPVYKCTREDLRERWYLNTKDESCN